MDYYKVSPSKSMESPDSIDKNQIYLQNKKSCEKLLNQLNNTNFNDKIQTSD